MRAGRGFKRATLRGRCRVKSQGSRGESKGSVERGGKVAERRRRSLQRRSTKTKDKHKGQESAAAATPTPMGDGGGGERKRGAAEEVVGADR